MQQRNEQPWNARSGFRRVRAATSNRAWREESPLRPRYSDSVASAALKSFGAVLAASATAAVARYGVAVGEQRARKTGASSARCCKGSQGAALTPSRHH